METRGETRKKSPKCSENSTKQRLAAHRLVRARCLEDVALVLRHLRESRIIRLAAGEYLEAALI